MSEKNKEDVFLCNLGSLFEIAYKKYDLDILDYLYHKGKATKNIIHENLNKLGIKIGINTVYNRMEELLEKGLIEEKHPGIYGLTKKGMDVVKCLHSMLRREIFMKNKYSQGEVMS